MFMCVAGFVQSLYIVCARKCCSYQFMAAAELSKWNVAKGKGKCKGKPSNSADEIQKCNVRRIRGLYLSMTEIMEVLREVDRVDMSLVSERQHKANCEKEQRGLARKEIFDEKNRYEIHNGFVRNKARGNPELIIQGTRRWQPEMLDILANAFLRFKGKCERAEMDSEAAGANNDAK